MSSQVQLPFGSDGAARPRRRRLHAPSGRVGTVVRLAAVVALASTVAACTGTTSGSGTSPVANHTVTSPAPGTPTTTAPVANPVITISPDAGKNVSPAVPIVVSVADGTLSSVKLVNPEGKSVTGELSPDGTVWRATEDLGYSKTYKLSAVASNSIGTQISEGSTFTTVTPGNLTMPYLQRTGGYTLDNGATYGVGIVPVVHFDEPITDEKAAERSLIVTTSPHVDGAWNWVDNQDAHWRPQAFYAPGTRVTVTAQVYGVQVGPGLYGEADQSVSFKIGSLHLAIANDKTHLVKVYFNNKLVRTMPTSMGQGGYATGVNGEQIPLWTMPGTYTVLTHENPAIMSSDSYGLPANAPGGYPPEPVYWSTKISTDGIYLHELDTTVWAQGNTDVSHGCLNLNHDNAQWYFEHSVIGDPVEVINTGGPKIQVYQNGDWSVPWATWLKGSAL